MTGSSVKKTFRLFLLAAVCGITPGLRGADVPAVEVSGKIRWVYDYEQGRQLARQNGKPMFVVFRCER